jgi:hypothetical protein
MDCWSGSIQVRRRRLIDEKRLRVFSGFNVSGFDVSGSAVSGFNVSVFRRTSRG